MRGLTRGRGVEDILFIIVRPGRRGGNGAAKG